MYCCRIVNGIKNKNLKNSLGATWNASHLAVRLCALRHWKRVSMPQTTQSLRHPLTRAIHVAPRIKTARRFTAKNHTKVDIFVIFVFKIIKSGYKTMFRLQNKKEYKIKMLHLYCLYHTESPDGQRLGRHIYI